MLFAVFKAISQNSLKLSGVSDVDVLLFKARILLISYSEFNVVSKPLKDDSLEMGSDCSSISIKYDESKAKLFEPS